VIRHCVVFRFAEGTTAEQVEALAAALRTLPDRIPGIEGYTVGADLGLRPANADFAVVADFADEDAFLTYSGHPDHLAVIEEFVTPIVTERHAVQFEW
jgi:hypothetical protein